MKNRTTTADMTGRRVLGYVGGIRARFNRSPFYEIHLDKSAAQELDGLLDRANARDRCTATISASFHQPARLRVTEVDPPEYERAACAAYVRGDAIRVQGREGVSCGMDLSARWGVPALRQELRNALSRASEFIILRVPSRKRDLIEIVPDVDLLPNDSESLSAAGAALAGLTLPREDFSDWPEGE